MFMKPGKKALFLMLLAVFAVSTALLLRQQADNLQSAGVYDDALAIAAASGTATTPPSTVPQTLPVTEPIPLWVPEAVEEDPVMEELAALDIAALQAVNADVLGWIRIPDTKIDYPLLQGDDNDYYLKHTWKGGKNTTGSIFLEYQSSPELTDFNTIIYGHNMNNGSMFAGLRQFAYEKHLKQHPYVYIATGDGVYRYEIFSTYRADVEGDAYTLVFPEDADRQDFLDMAVEYSKFDTGIHPAVTDRIVTLSTCSGAGYSTRWVVHARLKMVQQ